MKRRSRRPGRRAFRCGAMLGALAVLAAAPSAWGGREAPEVRRATLANGLRVVAVRSALAPVVTTVVNYGVGSRDAPPDLAGIAHAREHMMFRGSPGLGGGELAGIAAALGGRFNALTRETVTQYFFTVPAADLGTVLRIEALRMRDVLDRPEDWELERRAIRQELARERSKPESELERRVRSSLFGGSSYGRDPLGTGASLGRIGISHLRSFHRQWYAPNETVIVVAGDVEPDAALEAVRRHFESIPARKVPSKRVPDLGPAGTGRIEIGTQEPDALLTLWFRWPGVEAPDFAAAAVLARALGESSGPFGEVVAEGSATSARFSLDAMPGASLASLRIRFPRGGDPDGLEKTIREIVREVHRGGVPSALVEAAKRRLVLENELEKSSVTGLAMAWSRALAIANRRSPAEEVEAIAAATREDVARVARERLDPERAVVGLLRPGAREEDAPVPVDAGVSATPESPPPLSFPDWAGTALEVPEVRAPAHDASVTTLANGLRLVVRPVGAGSRAVVVLGRVETELGPPSPPGKEGAGLVLNALFSFGTGARDRVELQRALDEVGAVESMGPELSLRVLGEDLDRGLALLAEHLRRPRWTPEAFRRSKERVAAAVAGRIGTPGYDASRALVRLLFPPDHPRRREVVPETVAGLTLEDVRDHYHRTYRPGRITIAIVGDVDPAKVQALVEKHFGSWEGRGLDEYVFRPPLPPNEAAVVAITDPSRVQSHVTLAQTVGLARAHPDSYALELGNHVLGSALNASRLYRALRERTGLVYQLSSNLEAGKTRSFYFVSFACDPDDVMRARAIAVGELERMQESDVPARELARSRALLVRGATLSQSSFEEIARAALDAAVLGLPPDEPWRAARRLSRLTAADVREAFSTWIRPDGLAAVIHGGVE